MIMSDTEEKEKPPRVFGYIRVSTDKQETSLDSQKEVIENYCKYKHIPLVDDYYIDEDISGTRSLSLRPSGGKMARELRKGDTVIVTALDRIFRNLVDGMSTLELWKDKISLTLVDSGITCDTGSATGWAFMAFLLTQAEFYSRHSREKQIAYLNAAQDSGRKINGPDTVPYGTKAQRGKHKWLELNDQEYDVVLQIVGMKNAGESWNEIAEALFANGVRPRGNARTFSRSTLQSICSRYESGWYEKAIFSRMTDKGQAI